jgi:hypothetical protein
MVEQPEIKVTAKKIVIHFFIFLFLYIPTSPFTFGALRAVKRKALFGVVFNICWRSDPLWSSLNAE